MQFLHIVSGDSALSNVKKALALDDRDLLDMDDDLSIGPLADVDAPAPVHRAAFWRKVFGPQTVDENHDGVSIDVKLATTSAKFTRLANEERPCLVWCGTNPNEQLTLHRTAYYLRAATQPLWLIEVKSEDQKPLPPHWSTAVAVLRESELATLYQRRRSLDIKERSALAENWRRVCAESDAGTLRIFVAGSIETRPISFFDEGLLKEVTPDWRQTVRAIGNAMGHIEEHCAGDAFLFWRLRELAKRGHVEIDLPGAGMRDSKTRLSSPGQK